MSSPPEIDILKTIQILRSKSLFQLVQRCFFDIPVETFFIIFCNISFNILKTSIHLSKIYLSHFLCHFSFCSCIQDAKHSFCFSFTILLSGCNYDCTEILLEIIHEPLMVIDFSQTSQIFNTSPRFFLRPTYIFSIEKLETDKHYNCLVQRKKENPL